MPRLSPSETQKEIRNGDDLVFIGVEKPKNNLAASATVNDYTRTPGRWNAPMLNIHAARAVRHEEIKLGRALTQNEQAELIRKLSAGAT